MTAQFQRGTKFIRGCDCYGAAPERSDGGFVCSKCRKPYSAHKVIADLKPKEKEK